MPAATYRARLAAAERAAAEAGLDALVVYGDREHFANLSFLTGFDPRFEESMLIMVPGRAPLLLVGNEGEAYAKVVPAGVDVALYQSFSLVSQDRFSQPAAGRPAPAARPGPRRRDPAGDRGLEVLRPGRGGAARGLDRGARVHRGPAARARRLRGVNATGLFTEPGRGLRLVSDTDQLACFEFAATHGSESMRAMLHGVRPGLTELEAFSLYRPTGLPYSYHPVLLSGERAALGVASASGRVLRRRRPGQRVARLLGQQHRARRVPGRDRA